MISSSRPGVSRPTIEPFRLFVVLVSFAAVFLGFELLEANSYGVSADSGWFPTGGLALGMVTLLGWRRCWIGFLVLMLSEGLFGYYAVDNLVALALMFGAVTVIYTAFGEWLWHWTGDGRLIGSRDVMKFLVVACSVAVVAAVLIEVVYRYEGVHHDASWLGNLFEWWLRQAVGTVAVGAFVLIYARPLVFGEPFRRLTRVGSKLEAWITPILAAGLGLMVWLPDLRLGEQLQFLLILPVLWGAMRFGVVGASLSAGAAVLAMTVGAYALGAYFSDWVVPSLTMLLLAVVGLMLGGAMDDVTAGHRELEDAKRRIQRANVRLHHQAMRDPLTLLLNRNAFLVSLRKAIQDIAGDGGVLSVLLIDVDRFKAYNDTYGHREGDRALRTVARAIRKAVRGEDVIGRLGGDEFAVSLRNADRELAQQVADRVRDRLAQTRAGKRELTVSIGVAVGTDAIRAASLLDRADEGLYAEKAARDRRLGA